MVKMEVIETIVREVSRKDIILCQDRKGNWLHKKWCQLIYYEKYGCPRFHKDCMYIEDTIFEVGYEPFILVGIKCNFKKYIEEMRALHDDWSLRKLKTVIYYQGHLKNILKIETQNVLYDLIKKGYKNLDYTDRPEIYGVFLLAMMFRFGYEIELRPESILWKINMIYRRIDDEGGYYAPRKLVEFMEMKK